MSEHEYKSFKSVNDISLSTFNKITDIIDLSPENDWENIGELNFVFINSPYLRHLII